MVLITNNILHVGNKGSTLVFSDLSSLFPMPAMSSTWVLLNFLYISFSKDCLSFFFFSNI